jgi:hypothetical protein
MNWLTLKRASVWLEGQGVSLRPDSIRKHIVDKRYKPKLRATLAGNTYLIELGELARWANRYKAHNAAKKAPKTGGVA